MNTYVPVIIFTNLHYYSIHWHVHQFHKYKVEVSDFIVTFLSGNIWNGIQTWVVSWLAGWLVE